MSSFHIRNMHNYHSVRRYWEQLSRHIMYFETLALARPEDVSEVRRKIREMKEMTKDLYDALEEWKLGIKSRIEREKRLGTDL